MPNYRRAFIPGGTWFFTVNLLERHNNDLLTREIDPFRQVVRRVKQAHPFRIDAWAVLPEHMHCIFTLPPGDSDFSLRWRLIKSGLSRALPKTERRSPVRMAAGERGIWQRHYWEHAIRNDDDYRRHVDYIHWPLLRVLRSRHSCIHAHRIQPVAPYMAPSQFANKLA